MSQTNNKNKNSISRVRFIGLAVMAMATIASLVDIPERPLKLAVLSPAYAIAGEGRAANPLRREREESGPHYISYSATQRTPGRTGRY